MRNDANAKTDETPRPVLMEARYSLRELLREVEYERQHSILGQELVDQAEIKAIFKSRARSKPKGGKS